MRFHISSEYVKKRGRFRVLSASQVQKRLASFETSNIVGLRDRAFVNIIVYTFSRVVAVVRTHIEAYPKLTLVHFPTVGFGSFCERW
jgi:hypothetical protein